MIINRKTLPSVEDIKQKYPLSEELKNRKKNFDNLLKRNMHSREKLVVVSGPCSADNPQAVLEYCRELKKLQEQFPHLLVVARVYTTKPHSNGRGYQGLCFHEEENTLPNLAQGIETCRKLMADVLALGLPVADELLYPELDGYFNDLVSYAFVGARSSEDSLHRGVASALDICCGVKNPTNGLVDKAVNNLLAVSSPCVYPFDGVQTETSGNKFAHIVLRGGEDGNGYFSNLHGTDTALAKKLLHAQNLNDFVMVDLSHANSGKVAARQKENARIVAADVSVDGVMLESYLHSGRAQNTYGVSKTDECLDLQSTAEIFGILSDGFAKR